MELNGASGIWEVVLISKCKWKSCLDAVIFISIYLGFNGSTGIDKVVNATFQQKAFREGSSETP